MNLDTHIFNLNQRSFFLSWRHFILFSNLLYFFLNFFLSFFEILSHYSRSWIVLSFNLQLFSITATLLSIRIQRRFIIYSNNTSTSPLAETLYYYQNRVSMLMMSSGMVMVIIPLFIKSIYFCKITRVSQHEVPCRFSRSGINYYLYYFKVSILVSSLLIFNSPNSTSSSWRYS